MPRPPSRDVRPFAPAPPLAEPGDVVSLASAELDLPIADIDFESEVAASPVDDGI